MGYSPQMKISRAATGRVFAIQALLYVTLHFSIFLCHWIVKC